MSYFKKTEYEIVLKDSFPVLRGCPKCGRRTDFVNTKKFRVNANGGKLDVWLIYQCEVCKHTFNLTVYERQKVSAIPKKEYSSFLDNDERLADMYGKNIQLFRKNKADIDLERLNYGYVRLGETGESNDPEDGSLITIHNPYRLKIHPEKQIAQVLGLSRSRVKCLLEEGKISLEEQQGQWISFGISGCAEDIPTETK